MTDDYQENLAKNLTNSQKRDYRITYNQLYSFRSGTNSKRSPYGSPFFRRLVSRLAFLLPNIDYDSIRFAFMVIITCGIGKKQNILEIGCGDGLLSIAISKYGNNTIGTDVADVSIGLSNKNKRRFGGTNVRFIQMDCRELKFPAGKFDLVVSSDLVEHLHDNDLAVHLREVNRVLKKNGKYIVVTPSKISHTLGGLHLVLYSYSEIEKVMSDFFFVEAPMLAHFPFLGSHWVFLQYKKIVEGIICKFGMQKLLSPIFGVELVAVRASKK